MTLTKLACNNFTAFGDLSVDLSSGINVFIGANGTGKTHLMKAAYSACNITKSGLGFADKLNRVFLPSGRSLGRLVRRHNASSFAIISVHQNGMKLACSFSNHVVSPEKATVNGQEKWVLHPISSVYVPVKEMLSNAIGFRSLYNQREIHFEEIYADILDRAYSPPLRGSADPIRKKLMEQIQKAIDGKVVVSKEEFFLKNKQGNLEFTLLAEGIRKLGLLWTLIQNGSLQKGSVLFWDEPETNLNPKMFGILMQIMLELHRAGVQIFMATHDYVILKELELRRTANDKIVFHSLYRDDLDSVQCHQAQNYLDIHPNAIAQAFTSIYDREVKRTLSGV